MRVLRFRFARSLVVLFCAVSMVTFLAYCGAPQANAAPYEAKAADPAPPAAAPVNTGVLAAAEASAEAPPAAGNGEASHKQIARIEFKGSAGKQEKLVSFCLTADGRIAAVVQYLSASQAATPKGFFANLQSALVGDAKPAAAGNEVAKGHSHELRILAPDGKPLKSWGLDFEAQAINVGPDGHLYLGGNGQLASYDLDGKLLKKAEAPQMPEVRKDPARLRELANEQIEASKNALQEAITSFEEALKVYEGKADKDLSEEDREQKVALEQALKLYKSGEVKIEQPQQTVEQVMQEIVARRSRINALAVSDKHLFITCGASKGYGYAVWRVDHELQNPEMIVKSLSGCCGQMDIQCDGDELVVAENARHRVVRYDSSGKLLSSFGKRSRDGQLECFGGCCNPMNVQARGDDLYVSESDGQIKLFSKAGEFIRVVGVAKVEPGCKSSSIGVSPNAKRLYYIDIENSAIIVLAPDLAAQASLN